MLLLALLTMTTAAPRAPTCSDLGARDLASDIYEGKLVGATPPATSPTELELAVKPSALKVAPGAELTVLATLRNRGDKPLDLYFELGEGAGSLVHGFPVRIVPIKSKQVGSGPAPTGPVVRRSMLRLKPGETLCALARGKAVDSDGSALEPGKYVLEVVTGLASTLATPRATIQIK